MLLNIIEKCEEISRSEVAHFAHRKYVNTKRQGAVLGSGWIDFESASLGQSPVFTVLAMHSYT